MGALVQTFANSILEATVDKTGASVRLSTGPAANQLRCRLMTTNGSETAAGTELATSAGYTGGTSAPTVSFGTAASGSMASNTAVTVTNMPAPAGGSIVGIELWDATPARKWWGALSASKAVSAGDTFTIASGSLTLTLN